MSEATQAAALAILLKGDSLAPDFRDIAPLLRESQSAHLRYRQALSPADPLAARLALSDAANARARAEVADHTHADPAWNGEDLTLHAELLDFYLAQLSK